MIELSAEAYAWIKALHVVAVISWMAGMLYLPRLFVYHCGAEPGSELSETLKVMERRLLRAIMNPAMIATWLFGGLMLAASWDALIGETWMIVKLVAIALMTVVHHMLALWRKAFAEDRNLRPARFYRIANEVPTVLMIVIVVMVLARPF
ncbi:MAG: protoporphyrinogen oxidase HemJ [Rhodospirillaceae bacterium]